MNNSDYGEGSPCPVCGSDRITRAITYQIEREYNVKTGKLLKVDHSYRFGVPEFWQYRCRKCGWNSDLFAE